MKIQLLKFVDNFIGRALINCLPPPGIDRNRPVNKVLFIRPGGLGDALLLLPVIEFFAKQHPDAEIDILAEARNKAAYTFLKTPHRIELYTDPRVFFRLHRRRYDLVIDTEQWYRLSTVYARFLKPGRLIGFATNERARLLSVKVGYSLDDYECESFFHLLEPLGLVASQTDKKLGIVLDQKITEQTKSLLGNAVFDQWIAVFPGASLPEKRWPTENYCKTVKELQGKGLGVVIVGGDTECEVAGIIEAETGCANLAGKTSLAETGGVLVNTNLLISGDSALLHLAASLNVPTVSLFGPSDPKKWSPQGEQHRFLQEKFECVPCSRYGHIHACPSNVKCLGSLPPEDVLETALMVLRDCKSSE